MRISISPGNTKMGAIPSISLPPIVSCCSDVPCTKQCYARKAYRQYTNTRRAYDRNLHILQNDRFDFFNQLNKWLDSHIPEYFRFHVSGDFIDANHLFEAIKTAARFSTIKFLAFTKNHEILPTMTSLIPSNFTVMASMWPLWGTRPTGYRAAWVQDGTEDRIPSTALECPGNCENCVECWSGDTDVWFKLH